jgi:hypothetical protein
MPVDRVREAVRKRELEIAIQSLMREEAVVNYYAGRGYRILSQTDDETRQVFGIPRTQKAADVVAEAGTAHAIIAEVKGTDLDTALQQLASTLQPVQSRYQYVSCKIFVRNPTPSGDTVDLRGGGYGYKAIRIFNRGFPGEWLLMEYQSDGSARWVELGSEVVAIIFGPHL